VQSDIKGSSIPGSFLQPMNNHYLNPWQQENKRRIILNTTGKLPGEATRDWDEEIA
jgi:hypothetical protein